MIIRFGGIGCGAGRKENSEKRAGRQGLASRWLPLIGAGSGGLLAAALAGSAAAQAPVTSNGPPQEVIPQVGEVGMPNFTMPGGTTNPSGGSGGSGDGSGSDTGGSDGSGSNAGGSDALNTMLNQPWGITAINNAEALGVNPTAVAATCVMESGCQDVGSSGSSSATGAFQMMPSTYNGMISAALAQNPDLASSIVLGAAGMSDPATESIAASEYLLQGAQSLESAGISDPTVLQVRGYYNFGAGYGAQLAAAPDDEPMSNVLSGMSQSALAANGIAADETVGQWRSAISAKLGNAASQPVLAS